MEAIINNNNVPVIIDTDSEEEEEEPMALFLVVALQVVGIRFYTGVAHPGEYVNLVREPDNPYDRNAIRVDNLHGEKVGHIKATQAQFLSQIMDDMSSPSSNGRKFGVRKMDGSIPRKAGTYTMPLTLEVYGSVRDYFQKAGSLHSFFGRCYHISNVRLASAPSRVPLQPEVKSRTLNVKDWKSQAELDAMYDKQKAQLSKLPVVATPMQITTTLMPHQTRGLSWLKHREVGDHDPIFFKKVKEKGRVVWLSELTNASQVTQPRPVRGGLLCDDMGMGKSLMTICLILSNPPPGHVYPAGGAVDKVAGVISNDMMAMKTAMTTTASVAMTTSSAAPSCIPASSRKPSRTAVKKLKVAQLRAVMQSSLGSATMAISLRKPDLVQACLDGLDNGTITNAQFWSAVDDITGISASPSSSGNPVVAPITSPTSVVCKTPLPLSAGAISAGRSSRITTLIVCPVSVMSNWVDQVHIHVKTGVLRVQLYQGSGRHKVLSKVNQNEIDILLVSYHTLAADFKLHFPGEVKKANNASKKRKDPDPAQTIFDCLFHRVILDESHYIRNANSAVARACFKLQSTYRIGLTGTPLQNKPEDICSLLAFLGVEPLGKSEVFRRAVAQPIRNGDSIGLARLRAIMCHISLRRSKATEGIKLTNRKVEVQAISFPEGGVHKKIYDTLFTSAREAFNALISDGEHGVLKEYVSVLETLTRIRQACCSGALVPKDRLQRARDILDNIKKRKEEGSQPLTAEEGRKLLEKLRGVFDDVEKESGAECAVCLSEFPQEQAMILRKCQHIFCHECISCVAKLHNRICPLCRCPFEMCDMVEMNAASKAAAKEENSKSPKGGMLCAETADGELSRPPKISALLKSIEEMKADEKGVIFSQFTSFLDIIGKELSGAGYSYARIDGSMRVPARIEAMKQFNSNDVSSPRFILCSLLAAGTGINLTRGNHTFLMDLWWNKAVEDQAMDRVHRIGQSRDVRIVKFVMDGSIEERVIKMQDAKAALGKGSMEKLSPEEMRQARVSALKDLFQISSADLAKTA